MTNRTALILTKTKRDLEERIDLLRVERAQYEHVDKELWESLDDLVNFLDLALSKIQSIDPRPSTVNKN